MYQLFDPFTATSTGWQIIGHSIETQLRVQKTFQKSLMQSLSFSVERPAPVAQKEKGSFVTARKPKAAVKKPAKVAAPKLVVTEPKPVEVKPSVEEPAAPKRKRAPSKPPAMPATKKV